MPSDIYQQLYIPFRLRCFQVLKIISWARRIWCFSWKFNQTDGCTGPLAPILLCAVAENQSELSEGTVYQAVKEDLVEEEELQGHRTILEVEGKLLLYSKISGSTKLLL